MRANPRNALMFSIAAVLLPTSVSAVDEHHPDGTTAPAATQPQGTTAASSTQQPAAAAGMQALRERMQEMRRTRDPAKRMQLMEAQMAQMDEVVKNVEASCPMAGQGGGMMGGGTRGGGMMMGGGQCGMGGMGMMGGRGGMGGGNEEMMAKRLEMMEKRMDMMQMLLEQNATKRQAPAKR